MRPVILLGASNVALSFAPLVRLIGAGLAEPVHILSAHGHGRSYGQPSRVLARTLSGIGECGLWKELPKVAIPDQRPLALMTDVGNDLLYEVPPAQIVEWVQNCVTGLRSVGAQIVFLTLPIASVHKLTLWRFYLFRMLLFPQSRLKPDELRRRVEVLDCALGSMAEEFDLKTVRPHADWYGFDPIHTRRNSRDEAWQTVLRQWTDWRTPSKPSGAEYHLPFSRRPDLRHVFGLRQHTPQPIVDRKMVRVSLY